MTDADQHEGASEAEARRLTEEAARQVNWKRWGPYLAERQWGTVREDYSPDGSAWDDFPHEHARSRAYRWGEDGLLGFCDRQCRLCFAVALWNGRDPFLKERLFGLTGPQGNHGEDVKELYYYLDSTPTHSYCKAMYKYPQAAFPYAQLIEDNARRGKRDPELEITDTGVFDDGYFDVVAEYAKAGADDVLIRLTVANRGEARATLHLLPTLWFRNTWIWGCRHDGCTAKPTIERNPQRRPGALAAWHESLGAYRCEFDHGPGGAAPTVLLTENETNTQKLYGHPQYTRYVKDAFHEYVVGGNAEAVSPRHRGTKAAMHYTFELDPGASATVKLRLCEAANERGRDFGAWFDGVFADRIAEADAFYATRINDRLDDDRRAIARQAYAGLFWSKQFYYYVVDDWLRGDPAMPPPAPARLKGRNHDWRHVFSRDVISMPDKWEYPWFAAWDLAFHMVAMAKVDPTFAKQQLIVLMREWYMHPNGQLPAYEYAFSDVNPPVHAWACWRVYKMTGRRGERDRTFLASAFQKLLLNFTWWVNRKDPHGRHLFAGGFLGLDNIGVFDRSTGLPTGGRLEQADGTAWMAFYCGTMLAMALELAESAPEYEDMASKFFEHFVAIVDAMNHLGGRGLWNEDDGFYYDKLNVDDQSIELRVRSMVGIIPLFAVEVLRGDRIDRLKGFRHRMDWFLENRKDLARHITYMQRQSGADHIDHYILAIPTPQRLERVLRYVLDPREFLSPFGVRSMSKVHGAEPFVLRCDDREHRVTYVPGESDTEMFGGNSNWRGPIWFPLNYLLIEALQRYHLFFGEGFKVECPTGSGHWLTLDQVADELAARLCRLFVRDEQGRRACHGGDRRYENDPHFRDLLLYHEYFHAESGRGCGASHQTGWTALIARLLEVAAGL